MELEVEYLLQYLTDELKDLPELRIHPVAPSTTQKAPDLEQDYNPHEGIVHLLRGVRVRVSSREFFFPSEWAKTNYDAIRKQAQEIREYYSYMERK